MTISFDMVEALADALEEMYEPLFELVSAQSFLHDRDRYDDATALLEAAFCVQPVETGEGTDEMVTRAMDAYMEYEPSRNVKAMRAALEAALAKEHKGHRNGEV